MLKEPIELAKYKPILNLQSLRIEKFSTNMYQNIEWNSFDKTVMLRRHSMNLKSEVFQYLFHTHLLNSNSVNK